MEMSFVLLLLVKVLAAASSSDICSTEFSAVTPEFAVPGKTTAVLVTVLGPSARKPLNVTLKLCPEQSLGNGGSAKVIEITQEIRGNGILPLEIPAEATGNYELQTLVNCTANDSCALQSSSHLKIVGPIRNVIIRTAKRTYKPGEMVSFWVLALNHDLHLAKDVVGTISVKDPAGTKVALWDQVPLDEGVKGFRIPLSEYAISGKWLLLVETESMEFSTPFEVNQALKNGLPDNIAAAEEHYVELKFGKEMHRRYKPGLPFVGKVEVMSTEKTVRVRVKVYDNATSIYSQDIEISGGEGSFLVPAIMADSELLTLQAELVSVEGKEIESHYVLAREPVYKWNSSSDCYLLIEGLQRTLQPEEEASVKILSTCSCNHDLHYIITTDGRITDWAQRHYENSPPKDNDSISVNGSCQLTFKFKAKSIMAPVSQLLVYYITEEGEPISDFISFDVKLITKQIHLNLEERDWWLPDQDLDLEILAEKSSLVCLLGGRSNNGNDIRFNPRKSEQMPSKSMKEETDFVEAGVSFFQYRCSKGRDYVPSSVSYCRESTEAGPSDRRRPLESLVGGNHVDQLWLWKCFEYTDNSASMALSLTAPSETGEWLLWAFAISKEGLRFSAPVGLKVFRPLQADFHLPPNLRVGETVEVDIKIVNNLNSCMDVTALLASSEGAQFLSNGLLYVTERLRLGPQGATSLVVRLIVTSPGLRNMTVEVNGYSSPSCEGSQTNASNSTLVGAIIRSGTIDVHPEGILKTTSQNAYFCANENIIISTSDSYKYEWLPATRNRAGLILETKIAASSKVGPLFLALAESRFSSDRVYRITIGDADNGITWISKGKHDHGMQLQSAQTPGILSADQWRRFWLTWDKNLISFGKGSSPYNNTILSWKMNKKFKIQELGFASSWGSIAEFRIWNFNDESGFSQVLHLDTPKSVVPGSEVGQLYITTGLALPTSPAHRLGTGLAWALSSLSSAIVDNNTNTNETRNVLLKHIQTILSYRKMENSFSEHHMVESHLYTMSTLKILTAAQNLVSVDPELIDGIKRWLQLRQEDDGSFQPLPADIKYSYNHISSRTNLSKENLLYEQVAEITAETVIAFYQVGIQNDADMDTIQKAKVFLETTLPEIKTSEALAAVTLALVLLKSATSSWAIEKLRNVSTTEDGEFGWPHFASKRDAADWLYESDSGQVFKEPTVGTLEDFRASLYALSAFCMVGDLKLAESATRYLFYRSYVLDEHPELLHPTVEALSQYNLLIKDHHQMLTISLATSGMELTDTLQMTPQKPTQVLHLPSLPTKVFIYATGAGCGTIQGKIRYSTYESQQNTSLFELTSYVAQEILPGKNSVEEIEGKLPILKIRTCFRWKGNYPSGILRLEISLFSGYELTCPSQITIEPSKYMSWTEYGYNTKDVWFVIANVTDDCLICAQFIASSSTIISSLRPAYARIYPAQREDLAAGVFFHAKTGSSLLHGITEDDLITWFGKNGTRNKMDFEDQVTCEKDCNSCLRKTIRINSTELNYGSSAGLEMKHLQHRKDEAMRNITLQSINVDQRSINIMTEDMENRSENASINRNVDLEESENTSISFNPKNKLEIQTKIEKNFEVKLESEPNVSVSNTQQIRNASKNHVSSKMQKSDNVSSSNITIDKQFNGYVPKHVNTKISDVSLKYLQHVDDDSLNDKKEEAFNPEIKNDRYILLDKKELWGLLKEAVSDQIEMKLRRSEKEIREKSN